MKIEIAEHGRMTESGSSLLRLIQNQDIPLLDLLVRESFQNSLDAAESNAVNVKINITVGDFTPKDLNHHFEKIENGLNRRFRDKQQFIAISDRNTKGLTGPVRYSDIRNNEFGNLLKLVYEISKPQQNEGAGGSWGLGKTIYFRLGIGLVLYYSRIKVNGRFLSRLAACLVEDETRTDALIPYSSGVKRGIAWWGKRDGLSSQATIPIDNENEIQKILSVFGLELYAGDDTGTTVIVPYIDEKALLNEVYATNEDAEYRPYWTLSVQDYLKVAIQRWYAPRLLNAHYEHGPYLIASINESKLTVANMLSSFRIIRELYILATDGHIDSESIISSENVTPIVESIDLRGVLNTTSAGKVAYAKFNRTQLKMDPPENQKTPYQQINNLYSQMDGGNGPIVMFTRQPGMIVGYDYDGQWTHRMPRCEADNYIICLFVANSKNKLKNIKDQNSGDYISLEEYIRQGEKADHASWTDRNIRGNNPRIIANIQKNIINKIRKKYAEVTPEPIQKQNIGLSHALANLLLPAEDFGTKATSGGSSSGGGSGSRGTKKGGISIVSNPTYLNRKTILPFELKLMGSRCLVSLQVITDFRRYEADIWEDANEIGKNFPMTIDQIEIESLELLPTTKQSKQEVGLTVNHDHRKNEDSSVSIEIRESAHLRTLSYFTVNSKVGNCIVRGKLSFTFQDPSIKGALGFKEMR